MWQKLIRLNVSDWLVLGQAALLLPALNLALRRIRLDRVQSWLAARSKRAHGTDDRGHARAVSRMVDALARRTPFESNCLHRSLTTWFLLRRRGMTPTMRFGVKPDTPPTFHAWIEIDSEVINDRADIASTYLPFPSAIEPLQIDAFDG
jgi:hypothetical protein